MPDDARHALLTQVLRPRADVPAGAPGARRGAVEEDRRAQASAHAWLLGGFVVAGGAALRAPAGRARALAVVDGRGASGRTTPSTSKACRSTRSPRAAFARSSAAAASACRRSRNSRSSSAAAASAGSSSRRPPGSTTRTRRRRASTASSTSSRPRSSATRRRRSAKARARSSSTRTSFRWRDRAATPAQTRRRPRLALPLDRQLLVLRAGRRARGAGNPVSGFGAGDDGPAVAGRRRGGRPLRASATSSRSRR